MTMARAAPGLADTARRAGRTLPDVLREMATDD